MFLKVIKKKSFLYTRETFLNNTFFLENISNVRFVPNFNMDLEHNKSFKIIKYNIPRLLDEGGECRMRHPHWFKSKG